MTWTLGAMVGAVLLFVAVQILIGVLHSLASDLEEEQGVPRSSVSMAEASGGWR